MTRRERLERKLELREEWAKKAQARSDSHYNTGHKMLEAIPMGQPILIGHHSEKRDRAYRERALNHMSQFVAERKLAAHHNSKADGLEHALDRSIFSDDDNAVEAIEARIADNEAKRERMKTINKLYRKADVEGLKALGIDYEALKAKLAAAGSYWGSAPHLPYELSNLGGRITGDRKRLEAIKDQQARKASADAAPNGVTLEKWDNGYCRVTFADKPERSILDSLKAAGFSWGAGSWTGQTAKLPEAVTELTEPPKPIVIKGCPGGPEGKWDQVQAIQHQPFIFIMDNGSKWAGQEEDDIEVLFEVLAKHPLDVGRFGTFYDVDPCAGVQNPDWTPDGDLPKWIDGPRLYACDGVVRFFGNFETISHGFNIDTNHKPTIDTLVAAITKNLQGGAA